MRVPFAVGRVTPRSQVVVLVGSRREVPFPGPWRLQALVRSVVPRPAG